MLARRDPRPRQLPEERAGRGEPARRRALGDRSRHLAERPLPAPLPLPGLQRGRAGPARLRRPLRRGGGSGPRRRSTTASRRPPATATSTGTSTTRPTCSRSPTCPRRDPDTGATSGLLDRSVATGTVPKVFHVVTAYEYWNRAASLLHTDPTGATDVALPATSRLYFIASARHGIGSLPPDEGGTPGNGGLYAANPNDFRPALRALVPGPRPVGGRGGRAAAEPLPADRRRHARRARERWLARRARRALPARAQRAGAPRPRARVGARRDHARAAQARAGLPHPRPRGRRRRQRPRRPPPSRDRGAPRRRRPAGTGATRRPERRTRSPPISARTSPSPRQGRARGDAATHARPSRSATAVAREYLGRVVETALALVKDRLLLPEDVPFVLERAAAHWDGRPAADDGDIDRSAS